MVFNIVACAITGRDEKGLDQTVKQAVGNGQRGGAEVYDLQVSISPYRSKHHYPLQIDKSRFKVGTLDSLMELNETLIKVDQNLDSTCKKIEKQAKEMVPRELKIEVSKQQQGN